MKKISLILVLAILIAIFAGCSTDTGLTEQLNNLSEQIALLENRVSALEAENSALKAQLEATGNADTPSSDTPAEDIIAFAPVAALMFEDWMAEDDILTITNAFVRVSDLAMGAGLVADIHSCDLVLYWSGMELSKDTLLLNPGEASDSFELELELLRYTLPEMSEGDQLELNLEVVLSDGTALTAWGGSWEYVDGQLIMVAG